MSSQPHSYYDAIFFSPHFDDAILSAGGLIKKLLMSQKRVLIVTLFTQGDDTIFSSSTLAFLKASHNAQTSSALFKKRKLEDELAIKKIGADSHHLGYIDALFRKDNTNELIYPDFSYSFSGKVSTKDDILVESISTSIQEEVLRFSHKKTQLFGPLAVGDHVDHTLTFNMLCKLFKHVIFWQDVPYDSEYLKVLNRLADLEKKKLTLKKTIVNIHEFSNAKRKSVECYHTQLDGLKSAGLQPKHFYQEIYYLMDPLHV